MYQILIKKFVLLIVVLINTNLIYADDKDLGTVCLIDQIKNGTKECKYAYIDSNANVIIPPQFDRANEFTANGLALVKQNRKWGFINTKGKWVIKPQFHLANSFNDYGTALVSASTHQWGFINSEGKWAIEPRFYGAWDFDTDGFAYVIELKKGRFYINHKGQQVIPSRWYAARNKPCTIRKNISIFGDTVYVEPDKPEDKCKWGFKNADNKWVIGAKFETTRDFGIYDVAGAKQNGKWGFVNKKGQWVIPPKFDGILEFRKEDYGWAWAELNGKQGFINIKGEWVIPPKFDDFHDFDDNGLASAKQDGRWGFIDRKGNWVIPPKFLRSGYFQRNGLMLNVIMKKWLFFTIRGRSGLFNTKGELVAQVKTVCDGRLDILIKPNGKVIYPIGFEEKVNCKR